MVATTILSKELSDLPYGRSRVRGIWVEKYEGYRGISWINLYKVANDPLGQSLAVAARKLQQLVDDDD